MSESTIFTQCQIEASSRGIVLLRNSSGGFKDSTGRFVYFGLGHTGKGNQVYSSDGLGWRSVLITPEMVGQRIAQLIAAEIKVPGGHTDPIRLAGQKNFIEQIVKAGGVGGIVHSVEEFRALLGE